MLIRAYTAATAVVCPTTCQDLAFGMNWKDRGIQTANRVKQESNGPRTLAGAISDTKVRQAAFKSPKPLPSMIFPIKNTTLLVPSPPHLSAKNKRKTPASRLLITAHNLDFIRPTS